MKYLIQIFLAITFIYSPVCAQQTNSETHHAQKALNCQECHVCETPTYEKPCLKIMPDFTRQRGITVHHTAEDAPEILKIGILSNLYEPSVFTHRLHAEMAGMAGGCESCHHHNPPGRIAACRECHEAESTGTNFDRPGLKGAYHRQCLNCHRDWSHKNECTVCHAQKGEPASADKAALKEKRHPNVQEPQQLVYETDYDEEPVVTFFHEAHAERYGLDCVDCHKNESCSRCHDTIKKTVVTEADPHDKCLNCHESEIDDRCAKCHDVEEREPFEHSQTGFALNRFHTNLDCRACHGKPGEAAKLNPDCNSCHGHWETGSFDHQITGLMLDEFHRELDCSDCHPERNFAAKPNCTDCHDEISYPQEKPGKIIQPFR